VESGLFLAAGAEAPKRREKKFAWSKDVSIYGIASWYYQLSVICPYGMAIYTGILVGLNVKLSLAL
jgi:hypothetical protein